MKKANQLTKEGNMKRLPKVGAVLLAAIIGTAVLAGCPQDAQPEPPPPPTPTVTSVTVNPGTTVARRGDVLDFTATVSGANNHPTTVTWGVDGVPGTQITGDGRLTVANDETAATLTVRATSTFDATVSGTATVTVIPGAEPPGPSGWIADIDWSSHSGANIGFIVDNMSAYRLVAFVGSVHPNHLLGGIPALAENHGLFKDPSVFDRTRIITVVLVREEDLIEHDNAGTLPVLGSSPFTNMMVFHSYGMPNTHRHMISDRLGGRHRLIVANPTTYNVEFRLNSPTGPAIGFVSSLTNSTVIHLSDHAPPELETLIFPIFRFFNPVHQELDEIFPVWPQGTILEGQPWFISLATSVALPSVNQTINVQDLLNLFPISPDEVWIEIVNTTDIPIVFFQEYSPIPDSMGWFQIPSAPPYNRRTIIFSTRQGSGQPLPYLNIGDLWIGPMVMMRTTQITCPDGETMFQLRSDHLYRVLVSGSMLEGFTAILYIDDGERI